MTSFLWSAGAKEAEAGQGQVQSALDGALAAGLVTLLPLAMFLAVHWGLLADWVNLWSVILLSSGPILLITCLQVPLTL